MATQTAKRPRSTIIKVVLAALLSTALSIIGNVATSALFVTSPLPTAIAPYGPYLWPGFALLSFCSLCVAILSIPRESTPAAASALLPSSVEMACPICHNQTLKVHGASNGTIILFCTHCSKIMRVTYQGNTIVKLVIPGIITLVGIVAIAEYFNLDPGDLLDIILDIIF